LGGAAAPPYRKGGFQRLKQLSPDSESGENLLLVIEILNSWAARQHRPTGLELKSESTARVSPQGAFGFLGFLA
jgi:hypothetical protein